MGLEQMKVAFVDYLVVVDLMMETFLVVEEMVNDGVPRKKT
jgi:hypothetical protein